MHDGRAISCQISDRYFLFEETDPKKTGFGHAVWVDVMTNSYGDKADHKHCRLCLSLEDLERIVLKLRDGVDMAST